MTTVSATPEPEQARVRIEVTLSPGSTHAVVQGTRDREVWYPVAVMTPADAGVLTVYDRQAALNMPSWYRALGYHLEEAEWFYEGQWSELAEVVLEAS